MNNNFNVIEFINTHKNTNRNRPSVVKETLANAPAYITEVKHGASMYYKIYYKNNNKIVTTLRLKNTKNYNDIIAPLIKHGAVLKNS